MRPVLFTAALTIALTAAASAQDAPNAREAFVERRGLIEADARCRLLQPSIRDALAVGLAQARGALLRAGWSTAQVRELETVVVRAASARACNDARTAASVAAISRSVAQWANAGTMEFPGWERGWTARRTAEGWRLAQHVEAPLAATFGVRQVGDAQHLTLAIPVARGATAPASARLTMRNPGHVRTEINLTQRMAHGLEAGLPSPSSEMMTPSTRTIERLDGGRSQAVFTFPDSAFRDLLALDPRESVEISVQNGRATQRLLIEVGDIGAARAFLTLRR